MIQSSQHTARICTLLCGLSVILAASGCTAISSLHFGAEAVVESADPLPTYMVELHAKGKKPVSAEVTITEPVTVEEAIARARKEMRFKQVNVTVYRQAPGQSQTVRMNVDYESSKRRVSPDTNYTLYPGDRVFIKKNTRTMMDDILRSVGLEN